MKRLVCLALLLSLLLAGCSQPTVEQKRYTATFLDVFDTVTTIVGRYPSEKEFSEVSQAIHDALLEYHQLFDVYNEYEGLNNLKTINDQAGIAPVEADPRIIDLLLEFGVKECYFGHLHGYSAAYAWQGESDGIRFRLTSADALKFTPLRIR